MSRDPRIPFEGEIWGVFKARLNKSGLADAYEDRRLHLRDAYGATATLARLTAMMEFGWEGEVPGVLEDDYDALRGDLEIACDLVGVDGGVSGASASERLVGGDPVRQVSPTAPSPAPVERSLDAYEALAVAGQGKTATEQEEVRWVAAMIALPISKIKKTSVPSTTAVGMLKWAKTQGQSDFWKSCWGKLLPSKSEVEAQSRLTQAAGELTDLIDRVKAAGLETVDA